MPIAEGVSVRSSRVVRACRHSPDENHEQRNQERVSGYESPHRPGVDGQAVPPTLFDLSEHEGRREQRNRDSARTTTDEDYEGHDPGEELWRDDLCEGRERDHRGREGRHEARVRRFAPPGEPQDKEHGAGLDEGGQHAEPVGQRPADVHRAGIAEHDVGVAQVQPLGREQQRPADRLGGQVPASCVQMLKPTPPGATAMNGRNATATTANAATVARITAAEPRLRQSCSATRGTVAAGRSFAAIPAPSSPPPAAARRASRKATAAATSAAGHGSYRLRKTCPSSAGVSASSASPTST